MTLALYPVFVTNTYIQETIDLSESLGIFVQVRAGIDVTSRIATWELQALDPETGVFIIMMLNCY